MGQRWKISAELAGLPKILPNKWWCDKSMCLFWGKQNLRDMIKDISDGGETQSSPPLTFLAQSYRPTEDNPFQVWWIINSHISNSKLNVQNMEVVVLWVNKPRIQRQSLRSSRKGGALVTQGGIAEDDSIASLGMTLSVQLICFWEAPEVA